MKMLASISIFLLYLDNTAASNLRKSDAMGNNTTISIVTATWNCASTLPDFLLVGQNEGNQIGDVGNGLFGIGRANAPLGETLQEFGEGLFGHSNGLFANGDGLFNAGFF